MFAHLRSRGGPQRQIEKLKEYLQRIDDDATFDENNRALMQGEGAWLEVVIMAEHNMVEFRAMTNFLPEPEDPSLQKLYYHLLDINDGPETGLAYFSIVRGDQVGMLDDVLTVEIKRPLNDIDNYDEFRAIVDAVAEVAKTHAARIAEEYNAPRVTGGN